jgi:hypothetical protein
MMRHVTNTCALSIEAEDVVDEHAIIPRNSSAAAAGWTDLARHLP